MAIHLLPYVTHIFISLGLSRKYLPVCAWKTPSNYPWSGEPSQRKSGADLSPYSPIAFSQFTVRISRMRCLQSGARLTAACCAFIQRLVFSAVSSCCGLGAMQWSGCEHGEETLLQRLSPSAICTHLRKQLVPPSTGPQSLWEFCSRLSCSTLAFPHPWASRFSLSSLQVRGYSSFCVQAPPHFIMSLCGFVQCRILLLCHILGVPEGAGGKSLRVVCT